MTHTEPVTLPYTALTIPEPVAVTGIKELDLESGGLTWSATLRRAGKIVGRIENDGLGGMTVFAGTTANEIWFRLFATACTTSGGRPGDEEEVCNLLVEEYECAKMAADFAAKGGHLARAVDAHGLTTDYAGVRKPKAGWSGARLIAELSKRPQIGGDAVTWQAWDGGAWQHITTTEATGQDED